jgi:hypothetical protein
MMEVVRNQEVSFTDAEKKNGFQVIEHHTLIDPRKLFFDASYQRPVQMPRLKKIKQKIDKFGYLPHEVIAITDENYVVDGQHRARAAIEKKIEMVPVTIYKFDSLKDEAAFFINCNDNNSNVGSECYWNGKKLAGDKLAIFLHKLEEDSQSHLYKMIKVVGKKGGQRFSISAALTFIDTAFNINNIKWDRHNDHKFKNFLSKNTYEFAREQVNDVVECFYTAFGKSRYDNPLAYKTEVVRAFCGFYNLVRKSDVDTHQAARKMKTFVLTPDFGKLTLYGQMYTMVDWFNRGRTKNVIKYNQQ